ncbi:MAG: hypothetical protein M1830_005473 [Pleopsidium flavum]|nr:MAG: hypothetical protein M1830_005473 [Pleopsidium flavum]
MSLTYTIVKLNSSNYETWKINMEMLLITQRLWAVVSQQKSRPDSTDGKLSKAQSDFDDESERAVALIFLNIDDPIKHHVRDI